MAKKPAEEGGSRPPLRWTLGVAIGVLALFAIFAVVMFFAADTGNSEVWQRRLAVFGSIEAIVFTAVGWIFGREVHRTAADAARKEADEAKVDAKNKAEEADRQAKAVAAERERGKALRAAIDASAASERAAASVAGPAGRSRDVGLSEGTPASTAEAGQLAMLRDLAARLYDDVGRAGAE